MKDSQLINLMRSLTEKEIEEFKHFLNSPFYNNSATVKELFVILTKYYPLFTSPEYSKEKIFADLLPGKKYNNLLLNEYFHLLSNQIIEYLKQIVQKKNELKYSIDLLNEFRMRGLKSHFEKLAGKIEKSLSTEKFDHTTLHLNLDLHAAKLNLMSVFQSNNRIKHINAIMDDYEKYLMYMINVIVSEYLSTRLNFLNDSYNFNFTDDNLFSKLENDKIIYKLYEYIKEKNPFGFVINLNLALAEILISPEDTDKYYINKKLILESKDKFKHNELEHYFVYLKSYCIGKAYSPNTRKEFLEEYIKLDFIVLHDKIFINDKSNFLSNLSFRNLLIMLTNLKDSERILALIDYSIYLKPDNRTDYKNLAKAYYYYSTSSYDESIKFLKKIITNEKQLELDSNFLYLKIFYELKDVASGIDKISSFRRLINYDLNLSQDRKQKYRIFLNYLEKIFRRIEKDDEAGLKIIFEEISSQKNIVFAEWFEEKFEELFPKQRMNKKINA